MANAARERHGPEDLERLLERAQRIVVVRGKKVREFKHEPGSVLSPELAAAMLGPTGNLRAPTVRSGANWLVGFEEELWNREYGV